MPIADYGCTGSLSIDGVSLNCPAWDLPDLTDLWLPGAVRGDDRLLPGVVGVKAYKRRVTITQHSLPFLIVGDVDRLGNTYSDPWVGLQTNLAYLRTNVADPTNLTDGTRTGTLTMPDGTTRTADLHVLGIVKGQVLAGRMRATLELSIPGGVFA